MGNLTAFDGMVVVTSISLVFAMLIALCFILTMEGKLFDAAADRKAAAHRKNLPAAPVAPADIPTPVPAPAPAAPAVADGISGEVVAAISAAVYYLEGANTAIRGIRRLPTAATGRRRGTWGDAGVAQNVSPF